MACRNLHIVNSYTVPTTGTVLALNLVTPVASVVDKQRFCVKICVSIPSTYDAYTATVLIGGVATPLWNKYGNPLTIAELRRGVCYPGYYGATTSHVILNAPKNVGCNCGL